MVAHDLSDSALEGRVAIVTGAGRGIGRGIAHALARAGARVAVADIDPATADETAGVLRAEGHAALVMAVDVSERTAVETMAAQVLKHWGQIDILVNNAGINDNTPAIELSEGAWDKVLAVNLTGVFQCSQVVGRHMVERGTGRIINMSSSAAHFGAPNLAAYAASKAGILGLTRVLAVEWGPFGVTVNAVCPGNIETEMLREVFEQRGALEGISANDVVARIASKTPARRLGSPVDVAALVVFLASPDSSFITGQALNVCGGRTVNLS
jgi:NAD(P)-dependent dehydrogenase (short-subunit alcohol dehydrogenase family)